MRGDILEKYAEAGRIAAGIRKRASEMIVPGTRLLDVAEFVETEIERQGGKPAFPVNLAIDSIAAHYTPHSADPLRFGSGQVVKLDLGVHVDGYIADTAVTVEVGGGGKWSELIRASSEALDMVLDSLHPGMLVRDIGSMVERVIRSRGFEPIGNLSGHSLEQYNLHAGLSVPNISDDSGDILAPGTAVAIEPFATDGVGRVAGRKSGNIYKLLRLRDLADPEMDRLVKEIYAEFRTLPFPERWVAKRIDRPAKKLKKLLRQGILATYPILSEVKGGTVSQTEHTVIITDKGCVVTTR